MEPDDSTHRPDAQNRRDRADAIVAGLSKRSLGAAIKRVAKGAHSHDKAAAVERFTDLGESEAILWALLRAGHLASDDPALWTSLADDRSTADGQDVVTLLSGITTIDDVEDPKDDPGDSVPGWPSSLDAIVCEAYARDAEPIRSAVGSFSPFVERGLATVRVRFGELERDALPDEDWALTLARVHVARDGLGQHRKSPGTPRRELVRWGARTPEDQWGVDLWDDEKDRWGEALYEYVELFTTREGWARAVAQATEERLQRWGHVTVAGSWDAFLEADLDALVKLLGVMRDPHASAWTVLDARRDASADLVSLVERLARAGKGQLADLVAARAITALVDEGEPVTDEVLVHLRFRGYMLHHMGMVAEWRAREPYLAALRALPADETAERVLAHLRGQQRPEHAMAMAVAFLDGPRGDAIWDAVMTCAARDLVDEVPPSAPTSPAPGAALMAKLGAPAAPAPRRTSRRLEDGRLVAFSLALLDDADVPRLVGAFDDATRAGHALFADVLAWALVELLARRADRGLTWSVEHDRFLRSDRWNDADLRNLIRQPLDRASKGLSAERAAAIQSA